MDHYAVHRSAAKRLRTRFPTGIDIQWLPPYAPDLNPDEQVWHHTKYADLANFLPDDVQQLGHAMVCSFREIRGQQTLSRSFFEHAKLSL